MARVGTKRSLLNTSASSLPVININFGSGIYNINGTNYPSFLSMPGANYSGGVPTGNSTSILRADGTYRVQYARTNTLRNSTTVGVATGSPGTVPTNWSAISASGTGSLTTNTITGFGTEYGMSYIEFHVAGTATTSYSISFNFEQATQVPALQNQTWCASVYTRITGGSTAGIGAGGTGVLVVERNNVGAYINGTSSNVLPTTSLTRDSVLYVLPDAAAAYTNSKYQIAFTDGQSFDITLRFYGPQLEQVIDSGINYPTAYIPTLGSTAVTVNDIRIAAPSSITNLFKGTTSLNFPSNSVWTSTGTLAATNVSTPDGLNAAARWTRTATSSQYFQQVVLKTVLISDQYTLSIMVHSSVGNYFAMRLQGTYPTRIDSTFNLSNGTISTAAVATSNMSNPRSTITALSGGWYLCTISGQFTATDIVVFGLFSFNSNGVFIDGVDSVSNSAGYLYQPQLSPSPIYQKYSPSIFTYTSSNIDDYTAVRGNMINNSTMIGATSSTLPTGWQVGNNSVAFNPTVVGTGTEFGMPYLDVQVSGTPAATGSTYIEFISPNIAPAQSGQTFCLSHYCRLIAGSLTNVVSCLTVINYYGGGYLGGSSTNFTPTATLARYSGLGTSTYTATTNVYPTVGFNLTSGLAVNFTIRFYGTMLETVLYTNATYANTSTPFTYPTNYIPTLGSAASSYVYDTPLGGPGLLVEEASTNSLPTSDTTGAVAGSPGTLPNNGWSFVGATGITQTTAIGTLNGLPALFQTFSGTPGVTTNLILNMTSNTTVSATNGDTWTAGVGVALVGGSLTNVGSPSLNLLFRDSGGGALTNQITALTLTSVLNRSTNTFTAANASTGHVVSRLEFGLTNGSAINFTIAVVIPTLEKKAYATSPIVTSSAAVTRAIDVPYCTLAAPVSGPLTLFAQAAGITPQVSGNYPTLAQLRSATGSSFAVIFTTAPAVNGLYLNETVNSTPVINTTFRLSAFTAGGIAKAALSVPQGGPNVLTASNGGVPGITLSPWGNFTATTLYIGNSAGTEALDGYVSQVTVLSKALNQSQLNILTQ